MKKQNRAGHELGPLAPESRALTTRPPRLLSWAPAFFLSFDIRIDGQNSLSKPAWFKYGICCLQRVECDIWLVIEFQAADCDHAIEYDIRSIRILRWNHIHSQHRLTWLQNGRCPRPRWSSSFNKRKRTFSTSCTAVDKWRHYTTERDFWFDFATK